MHTAHTVTRLAPVKVNTILSITACTVGCGLVSVWFDQAICCSKHVPNQFQSQYVLLLYKPMKCIFITHLRFVYIH